MLLPAALLVERAIVLTDVEVRSCSHPCVFLCCILFGAHSYALVKRCAYPMLALACRLSMTVKHFGSFRCSLRLDRPICFIPVRIYLAWDFFPAFVDRKMEVVHGWHQWAQDVHRFADGRNVVFLDDYRSAGRYSYYTGETAHSYNSMWYQSTQHDIWPIEENFRGKRAMIVNGMPFDQFKTAYARNRAGNRVSVCRRFRSLFEGGDTNGGQWPSALCAGYAIQSADHFGQSLCQSDCFQSGHRAGSSDHVLYF